MINHDYSPLNLAQSVCWLSEIGQTIRSGLKLWQSCPEQQDDQGGLVWKLHVSSFRHRKRPTSVIFCSNVICEIWCPSSRCRLGSGGYFTQDGRGLWFIASPTILCKINSWSKTADLKCSFTFGLIYRAKNGWIIVKPIVLRQIFCPESKTPVIYVRNT